jgi:hypothetical protein
LANHARVADRQEEATILPSPAHGSALAVNAKADQSSNIYLAKLTLGPAVQKLTYAR